MGLGLTRVMDRTCGDCQACCTYLPVSEVDSKALEPCQHQSDAGCAIYETRPEPCQGYSCMWLYGYGADADRPDRSGVLVDNLLPIAGAVQCKPLRAGAADTPEGNRAIRRIARARNQPALVAGFPETHMVRVVGRGPK